MKRLSEDIHNSNPGEELNFHGQPNDTAGPQYGRNYGYPGCVAIYDPSNVRDFTAEGGPKVGLQMKGDHLSDYTDDWCRENATAPRITFGSHLAPLDIRFLSDGSAALISFHGSWYVLPNIPGGDLKSSIKVQPTNKKTKEPSTSGRIQAQPRLVCQWAARRQGRRRRRRGEAHVERR